MTPDIFTHSANVVSRVYHFKNTGALAGSIVNYVVSLRPSVSLKLGTEYQEGGTGTVTNPYIVKYN